jgi:hypothetical protein
LAIWNMDAMNHAFLYFFLVLQIYHDDPVKTLQEWILLTCESS